MTQLVEQFQKLDAIALRYTRTLPGLLSLLALAAFLAHSGPAEHLSHQFIPLYRSELAYPGTGSQLDFLFMAESQVFEESDSHSRGGLLDWLYICRTASSILFGPMGLLVPS